MSRKADPGELPLLAGLGRAKPHACCLTAVAALAFVASGEADLLAMIELAHPPRTGDDTLWAVMASMGRTHRVAEVFPSRAAALADRAWREQQVRAYGQFLRGTRQPVPLYSVTPIRRTDLPKSWTPLPALGFLRGKFL